jgi:hypothetical protein
MMAWLASLQGAIVLFSSALLMGWSWLKFVHDPKVASKVTTEIVQRSEKTGAQNAAKSAKAHSAARQPGAADRLRSDPKTCPDCK